MANRGDDELIASGANGDLVDPVGQAHVCGKANSLAALIDEHCTDTHSQLPSQQLCTQLYFGLSTLPLERLWLASVFRWFEPDELGPDKRSNRCSD